VLAPELPDVALGELSAAGSLLEAEPVDPVWPELVPFVPSAFPDLAPESVAGLAEAEPVEPPLPELPEVGFEFTVAGPVAPVDPVLPEFPDLAPELDWQKRAMHGAMLIAGPVWPEFPELPEFPDVAELPFDVAFPVSPELALPDLAVVSLFEEELASPLFPP
jgi:homeobox protein ESX1